MLPVAQLIVAETERLRVRPWRTGDLSPLTEMFGDPRFVKFTRGPMSREQVEEWMRFKQRLHQERGYSHWGVERLVDSRLIGYCGLAMQQLPEGSWLEIGYRLAQDCWGRGLATEAATACRDWAFANLDYGELIAIIEPDNSRSIRVAEKLGMASRFDTVYHGRRVSVFGMDNPRGGEKGPYAS